MKSILIIQNHLGPTGGIENHVLAEIELLKKKGYDVKVFALSSSPEWQNREDAIIYWHRPPPRIIRRILAYLFHPGIALSLFRLVRRLRPELIHLHAAEQPLSLLPVLFGQTLIHSIHTTALVCPLSKLYYRDTLAACPGRMGIKCIKHQCINILEAPIRFTVLRIYRLLIQKLNALCAPPSPTVAELLHNIGLRRVQVLPLFTEFFDYPKMKERSSNKILFVGSLEENKGPSLLLDAFVLIHAHFPGATLVFVGDGPQQHDLQVKAQQLGISPSVYFLGRLNPERLVQQYDEAAVCVIPSLVSETFGLVAYEAMARGCPLVLSQRGALKDIARYGELALFVEPTDRNALAAAVMSVLRDPQSAARRAIFAQEVIRRTYNSATFLQRFQELAIKASHASSGHQGFPHQK